ILVCLELHVALVLTVRVQVEDHVSPIDGLLVEALQHRDLYFGGFRWRLILPSPVLGRCVLLSKARYAEPGSENAEEPYYTQKQPKTRAIDPLHARHFTLSPPRMAG